MRLIDADVLIKDIDYSADMGGALGKVVECVKYYAKYMVASAPTIKPERKKGEWNFEEYPDGYYHSECSVCGSWFKEDAFLNPYNFCPNCGSYNGGKENVDE